MNTSSIGQILANQSLKSTDRTRLSSAVGQSSQKPRRGGKR